MVRRTVSLTSAAYEQLRAAKRLGKSFSQTVNRLLENSSPSFRVLACASDRHGAADVGRAIVEMGAGGRGRAGVRFGFSKLDTVDGRGQDGEHAK
jgi:predicted CopG family antitoxin